MLWTSQKKQKHFLDIVVFRCHTLIMVFILKTFRFRFSFPFPFSILMLRSFKLNCMKHVTPNGKTFKSRIRFLFLTALFHLLRKTSSNQTILGILVKIWNILVVNFVFATKLRKQIDVKRIGLGCSVHKNEREKSIRQPFPADWKCTERIQLWKGRKTKTAKEKNRIKWWWWWWFILFSRLPFWRRSRRNWRCLLFIDGTSWMQKRIRKKEEGEQNILM